MTYRMGEEATVTGTIVGFAAGDKPGQIELHLLVEAERRSAKAELEELK